jgi:hypothetical protein
LTPVQGNVFGSGLETGGWDHGRAPGGSGALGYGAEAGYLQGSFIAPGLHADALRWPVGWKMKTDD